MVFWPFEIFDLLLYSLPLCIFEALCCSRWGGRDSLFLHRFTAWLVLHGKAVLTSLCKASWGHSCLSGGRSRLHGARSYMAQRLEVARRCSVGEKVRTVDVMTGSRTRLGDREVEEGRKEKSSSNTKPPLTCVDLHDYIHDHTRFRLRLR